MKSKISVKVLYGLQGNKILIMDVDTSEMAKKLCIKEGCTSVIVADKDSKLSDAFINELDVDISMFKGIVL